MTLVEELTNMLHSVLLVNCPVLSGNTKKGIEVLPNGEHETTIIINAPFYDLPHWKKTNEIVYTKQVINGRTDYSAWVNELGAFGKPNKSKGWTNRSCLSAAIKMAAEWETEYEEVYVDYRIGE